MNLHTPYSSHPFEGCWLRIDRAGAHRQSAVEAWNAFLDTEPYSSVFDLDDNGKGVIWVDNRVPIPAILSVLMGEFFYNLRAALDYAVYDTAIHDTGSDPPPHASSLQFPICTSPVNWHTNQHRLRPLSEKHRSWIESVQPYQRTDGVQWSPLYWLNEIARKERHRALQVTGAYLAEISPEVVADRAESVFFEDTFENVLLQDGAIVARFQVVPYEPGEPVEANPNSAIDIEMAEFLSREPDVEWVHLPLFERLAMIDLFVRMIVGRLERDCTGETRMEALRSEEDIETSLSQS